MDDCNENGTLPPQLVNSEAIKEYIPKLFIAAKTRWLKAYEILQILQNYHICEISVALKDSDNPPSNYTINEKAFLKIAVDLLNFFFQTRWEFTFI